MTSPFITHRAKVLGTYGAAAWLRSAVLAMWNGDGYQVGLTGMRNLDYVHRDAFYEMLTSYLQHGEGDPAFMDLAEECRRILGEERAAEERYAKLDAWLGDARYHMRKLGLQPGLTDDRYEWFAALFDAGIGAEEAAQKAQAEKPKWDKDREGL